MGCCKRLKRNKARGHTHIQSEHLQGWLQGEYPVMESTTPNPDRWGNLVGLVQHMWESRTLPAELSWNILVLISKGNPETWGVGLLEVLWKVVETIIDTCIKMVVTFHGILHGFRASRDTGTATIELKIAQELESIDQDPLFLVFMDLRKQYNTL